MGLGGWEEVELPSSAGHSGQRVCGAGVRVHVCVCRGLCGPRVFGRMDTLVVAAMVGRSPCWCWLTTGVLRAGAVAAAGGGAGSHGGGAVLDPPPPPPQQAPLLPALQVCGGPALSLLRAEELELMVAGLPHLDFDSLEKGARYEGGYSK